ALSPRLAAAQSLRVPTPLAPSPCRPRRDRRHAARPFPRRRGLDRRLLRSRCNERTFHPHRPGRKRTTRSTRRLAPSAVPRRRLRRRAPRLRRTRVAPRRIPRSALPRDGARPYPGRRDRPRRASPRLDQLPRLRPGLPALLFRALLARYCRRGRTHAAALRIAHSIRSPVRLREDRMNPRLHLEIAGALLIALGLGHAFFEHYLGWNGE